MREWIVVLTLGFPAALEAAPKSRSVQPLDNLCAAVDPKVVAWRHDIHQHPELSGEEVRTANLVAEHLQKLGMEVRTGIAKTGVLGVLRGGRPGPVVALRADMDALPVTEETGLPFASKETVMVDGAKVGVMHACGHDTHVAMLMGAAEVLTSIRQELPGSVMFIFQPSEERPTLGGAAQMLAEGLFAKDKPAAIFALHAWRDLHVGELGWRSGARFAAADPFTVRVKGRQAHGAAPWDGVDPIVLASQIVLGIQTIASRQVDPTTSPVVVTVGVIKGGVRPGIIPEEVELQGTVRSFGGATRDRVIDSLKRMIQNIAEAGGGTAEINVRSAIPVTINDPHLVSRMKPVLERLVGPQRLKEQPLVTGSEDFAFYAQQVPGFYIALGVTPADQEIEQAGAPHGPRFKADDSAMTLGVRTLVHLATQFLAEQ